MATRRSFLFMGSLFAVTETPAWALGLDSMAWRYRNWLEQFQRDLDKLVAGMSEERVGLTCNSSIVPHSRAALMISEWVKDAVGKRDVRHGAIHNADLFSITVQLLGDSTPAGYGGLFHEPSGSRFPSGRFRVWYMHIGGPDALQAYFDDKTFFSTYKLPPHGTLKRHAYPFLLFEEIGTVVRLAGIGTEWMGAAVHLHRKQLF